MGQAPFSASLPAQAELRFCVRPYDTDFMGIVNNLVYLRWFEDLRERLLDGVFPLKDMLACGKCLILYETHIRHLCPLTLGSEPLGKVWMEEVGRTLWKMRFEISDRGACCCEGWQKGCYYDLGRKRPAPFPPEFLKHFAQ